MTGTLIAALGIAGLVAAPAASAGNGPQVVITSPSAGATVSGVVEVAATATTDTGDTFDAIELYVDDVVNPVDGVACGGQTTCSDTLYWDASGLSGTHVLQAVLWTTDDVEYDSQTVSVTVVSPPPTVTVSGLVSGSTVKGVTEVTVTGQVEGGQTDSVVSLRLYADGREVDTVFCSDGPTCTSPMQWDATGWGGPVNLLARVQTASGVIADSASVAVTAVTPAPTAAITSPAAEQVLDATVPVTMTASIDAALTERVTSMDLVLNYQVLASVTCDGAVTCTRVVNWPAYPTPAYTGPVRMTVRVHTSTGRIADLGTQTVYVRSGSSITLKPATVTYAGVYRTIGGVVRYADGRIAAGVPVTVTGRSALGATTRYTTTTNYLGNYSVRATPLSTTTYTATVTGPVWLRPSSASVVQKVVASLYTKLKSAKVRHGAKVYPTVYAKGVLKGTAIRLEIRKGTGRWVKVYAGYWPGGTAKAYSFTAPRSTGSYQVRAYVSGSRSALAAYSNAAALRIT